jgi:hypothetical protein
MSIQQMAERVLDLTATDQEELEAFAQTESAAFVAYVNDYAQSVVCACGKKDN